MVSWGFGLKRLIHLKRLLIFVRPNSIDRDLDSILNKAGDAWKKAWDIYIVSKVALKPCNSPCLCRYNTTTLTNPLGKCRVFQGHTIQSFVMTSWQNCLFAKSHGTHTSPCSQLHSGIILSGFMISP